jgi:hypothetical protein
VNILPLAMALCPLGNLPAVAQGPPLPNLVGWWKQDAGLYTDDGGAPKFVSANSQYLSIASNASLQDGNIDFSFAGWVFLDSFSPSSGSLWGKTDAGKAEFSLATNAANVLRWLCSADGSVFTLVQSGVLAVSQWYFVHCYHDAALDQIGFQIDNGTPVTASFNSAGPFNNTSSLTVGRESGAPTYTNARVASLGFWKRRLTAGEVTNLYNGGRGKQYSDLTTGEKANLISWWNLNEASGTRNDSHGTNHLTDNNGVTREAGIPCVAAAAGNRIVRWEDQSGQARHLKQDTLAKEPILTASLFNGLPGVRFDGVDDFLLLVFPQAKPAQVYGTVIPHTPNGVNLWDGGAGNAMTVIWNSSNQLQLSGGTVITDGTLASGTKGLVTSIFTGGSDSQIRLNNGTPVAGNAGSGFAQGIVGTCLGSRATGTIGWATVDCAEVLLYAPTPNAIGGADDLAVLGYLNGRYAVY